ncbi:NtaA/DmoA family FMN-dependent monooxygenase [Notoacmeibacter ruber]|uniref:LLM class flavin-dependent oxidoreductase n=1 Tax=Notoacmeibacter ruber TaxID=2670375 RepID=A0A3L7J3Z1_9HYPH|nr:NtaA/DmoA family FMN-dependent monooxygenase [Notoacmeibacter ruber]RLQ85224.1 LLM class flavin-dependent oxidoreductase [Notoacmeibacter ruber]
MPKSQLHIGLSLSATWLGGEAWRREDSAAGDVFDLSFYRDIARRAEAAKLDFLFRADSLFCDPSLIEKSPGGLGGLDPTLLFAALATETRSIGLLTTLSTQFYPPYIAARQLQSLNRLSKGRAGWNIVTGLDGHQNFGREKASSSAERYRQAGEFERVVQELWRSFPAEAITLDRSTGRFADATRIRPIDHRGEDFAVAGPLNLPALPNAPIPIAQAGASPDGRDFAAAIADLVFAATPDRDAAIELRADLNSRAAKAGRRSGAIRVLPGLNLYLAETDKEAEDLFAFTHRNADRGRKLELIKRQIGLDLSEWRGGRAVRITDLPPLTTAPRSATHAELLRRLIERETPTVDDLLRRPEVSASAHWQIVGTPESAAETIDDWVRHGAIDGFIALPGGSIGSLHLVLERLVPLLVEEGLFRRDYESDIFAGHLNMV